ncbi:hypothetical protein JBP901_gp188 [Bacillus phage JBP901]|uniref:Uncharacterized protein n=2 Tax=Caeruleovirus TaxID=1911929 RepID=A0A0E3DEP2_9CAUD|nr:hypothetical protein JBP901_gp188 [Bacillus phage JBP901]YP_009149575.1 hypothetical protein BCP8-2_014 [Bacillus phage BCP8-2]AHJ87052.1 hypothetical protein BCP8-2_014 [Bacillus phage BCP8-2]AID17900.1 hypothetical protein JBP901_gp188 [Bacillus phage JBP901]BEU14657.1 hypothetical protein [Bacillus phage CM1]
MAKVDKEVKEVKQATEVEPIKPYVHVDTFLQTAVPMFNMNNMQAAGFRALMNGRHYQTDEKVFLDELKQYLGLE